MVRGCTFLDSTPAIAYRFTSRQAAEAASGPGNHQHEVNPVGLSDFFSRELREERALLVEGADEASQVVNWLNEILFLFDAEGLVFEDFAVDSWSTDGIRGRARGEHLDPLRHEIRTAVKAATYHQFEMRTPEPGVWEIRVFMDV